MTRSLKESEKNGLIARVIENWLINAKEIDYQLPYCQVLLYKGHTILQNSRHGPLEQGKDIVTIDKKDNPCAFQLKTGNIKISQWRKYIEGEIFELIQHPVIHPSIDKSIIHKSFLVTNGTISDEVRTRIDQINEDNIKKRRNFSYLDVIEKNALLKEFIDAEGAFIPKQLRDFHLLLELFLSEGSDFFPKDKYLQFLRDSIFNKIKVSRGGQIQKKDALNAISGSLITTSLLLKNQQIKHNYYALFEAWITLAISIVYYSCKLSLTKKEFQDSLQLIISEIELNLKSLREEVIEGDIFGIISGRPLLEMDSFGEGGLVYKVRVTLILGALAAFEVYLNRKKRYREQNKRLLLILRRNLKYLIFWGDSAFPFYFNIIKYLEINKENGAAIFLLKKLMRGLVFYNHPDSVSGFASVEFTPSMILEKIINDDLQQYLEIKLNTKVMNPTLNFDFYQFPGSSYVLNSIVLMLARRNERRTLAENWRGISHILFDEYKTEHVEDLFDSFMSNWAYIPAWPKKTQSWGELVKEAQNYSDIPKFYVDHSDLLELSILVFPYLANKLIIGLLDCNT